MKEKHNLLDNRDNVQFEKDMHSFLRQRILKECPTVPVKNKITIEEFKKDHIDANKPVILKGVVDNWDAMKKWEFDYFANKCGDAPVEVNLYDAKNIKKSNIKTLIDEIKNATLENPVYLQEWWFHVACPSLFNDVVVPPYFTNDKNNQIFGYYNSTLWIGSKGASTPVHQDTTFVNIWTVQARGKKEWILFDKNAVLKSDKNGNRDYDEFLSNPENNVMHYELEAGDLMYVPWKWWHRAHTLENSISMNTFYITDEIVSRFVKSVMAIPMAVSLNSDLLKKNDPRRYNICMERLNILSELLGYNKENVLGVKVEK